MKLLKSETSRVIRIAGEHYDLIQQEKAKYAKRNGLKRATYDAWLGEVLNVSVAINNGEEFYEFDGKLYADLAEARGDAIMKAKREGMPVRWPTVLVKLGSDQGPR